VVPQCLMFPVGWRSKKRWCLCFVWCINLIFLWIRWRICYHEVRKTCLYWNFCLTKLLINNVFNRPLAPQYQQKWLIGTPQPSVHKNTNSREYLKFKGKLDIIGWLMAMIKGIIKYSVSSPKKPKILSETKVKSQEFWPSAWISSLHPANF